MDNVEVIIGIDEDDIESQEFVFDGVNLKKHTFTEHIGDFNGHAYRNNILAKLCQGDVLWILSDEIVLHTHGWDEIAAEKIEDSNMQVWLGQTNDFVITDRGVEKQKNPATNAIFSCFPMMSKKAHDALGYFLTPAFRGWGCDSYLELLFGHAYIRRMLDLTMIDVEHFTTESKVRMDVYKEDIDNMVKAGDAKYLANDIVMVKLNTELINLKEEIDKWNYL